jgi:hypothetical protein
LPYCPKCGAQVEGEYAVCPICGEQLKGPKRQARPTGARASDHLSLAYRIASSKPMVFAPVLLGSLISTLVNPDGWSPLDPSSYSPVFFVAALLSLAGSVLVYLLNFASIDMARDAYVGERLDLGSSMNYVVGRIGTFIVASIVGVLLSITIILIPVSIFMFVIIVMDETSVGTAVSRAWSVITRDIGDVTVIILASIIGTILLSFVPLIGGLLTACLGVVIDLAFISVYENYRSETY